MSIFTIFSLLGGVGLFLFGMTMMSTGLRNACGSNLQGILEKATKNRVFAILVGVGITMLIQSSSATDVMVIGFVNSGMMTLAQAIGVIMGANIGTTITAQITAFSLSNFTPLLLFIGVVLYVFVKRSFIKHVGSIIMGFGMLFQGIIIMKAAIVPLSETQGFADFMTTLSNPILALLFGVAFTALLQSSSSSIVIFQAFAVEGILTYDIAVYLIIGAAIGSVTPNLLASLTANRNGKRTALLNLLFNLIRAGILIAIINLVPGVLDLIQSLSPGDVGRQIANTHTIFAIVAVLIEAPFAGRIIKLTQRIVPVLPEETQKLEDRELKYMNVTANMPTAVALGQAHMEIARMGRIAYRNLKDAVECFFSGDQELSAKVKEREETVDILNQEIGKKMVVLRGLVLTEKDLERVSLMTIASTDIERVSDHAENIVEYNDLLVARRAKMSDTAREELREMSETMLRSLKLALEIFENEDYEKIPELYELEDRVDQYENDLISNHVDRLMHSGCDPTAGVVFSDIVTDIERCGDHAINIANSLRGKIIEESKEV
ncbi:MAG: Na/Pi cotransporter family protein [Eubacterium sp.]|nr:Na/Pi cotransporter family protein [Eubacterium sp.]